MCVHSVVCCTMTSDARRWRWQPEDGRDWWRADIADAERMSREIGVLLCEVEQEQAANGTPVLPPPPGTMYMWPPWSEPCSCRAAIGALISRCSHGLAEYQRINRLRARVGCECFAVVFRLYSMCMHDFSITNYFEACEEWALTNQRTPRSAKHTGMMRRTVLRPLQRTEDTEAMWFLHTERGRQHIVREVLQLIALRFEQLLREMIEARVAEYVPPESRGVEVAIMSVRSILLTLVDLDAAQLWQGMHVVAEQHELRAAAEVLESPRARLAQTLHAVGVQVTMTVPAKTPPHL